MAKHVMKGSAPIATGGTKAEWEATTEVIPAGMWIRESDTGKLKITDGSALYSALPYAIQNELTDAEKAMLEKQNTAGGVVVLDGSGLIPTNLLDISFMNKTMYVADITARDAIPEAERTGVIVVADASGDPTVESSTKKMAFYGWKTEDSSWVKLGEQESFDMDFSMFFDFNKHTLADIPESADGTIIHFTKTYKDMVDELAANVVRKQDEIDFIAKVPGDYTV